MPRIVRVAGPAVLVLVAFVALIGALAYGGGANPPELLSPGSAVLYGVPIAKLLADLAVATTIGALALAVFALSSRELEFTRALDIAAAGAAVWTVSGAASAILVFQNTTLSEFTLDDRYGAALGSFLTEFELGRAWLIFTLAGAVLTVLCFAVRNVTALAVIVAAAVLALVPLAQSGHAAEASTHAVAVTAIWLHTTFAALWVGGLITLVLARGTLRPARLAAVLPRYSTIALICFIVVAASGAVSAAIRVGELPNLLSPYGILVLVKVGALGALGLLGALQRRSLVRRIVAGARPRLLWALVATELAVMAVASGVASALARTANPIEVDLTPADPTPAEILTGNQVPPELTLGRYLTAWNLDLLWALVAAFGIVFYLVGVGRLRRRGDRWPVHRTVLWVGGMLGLFWVTNGPVNVYEQYLFSAHMLGHMLLGMAIPVLLVLSAPVTLALRSIHKRDDGSRGPREWILLAVHSRVATALTHPLVAGGLFAASLWAFYYTPLFRWATEDHVGHTWMVVHFLIVGYLFAQTLVGIDPVAARPPYPLRLLLLLATMAMHAFFGLTLMTGTGLLLADWYGAMGRTWGLTPLADQQAAGGIAWSVGEIPTVLLAIVVAMLWSRSDAREARRTDRAADRDGGLDLEEYNAMLAKRARDR